MNKFLLCINVCGVLVLSACSKEMENVSKKPESSHSSTQVLDNSTDETSSSLVQSSKSTFDSKSYLMIDPTKVTDDGYKGFTLSPLVKNVVGTYAGVSKRGTGEDYLVNYQIRIKEDGTYIKLSRNLTLIPNNVTSYDYYERVYLDSNNQMKMARPTTSINGQTYSYNTDYIFERGILVEKFGKLHFVPLSTFDTSAHQSTFTEINGQTNLAKDLISDFIDLTQVPDSEQGFENLIQEKFDYHKKYQFEETNNYIVDGKVMLENTEIGKSDDVDQIVSEDLDKIITPEMVESLVTSTNDLVQIVAVQKGFYQPKLITFTDYSKIYNLDGSEAKIITAVLDESTKILHTYQKGKILSTQEKNGTYVLPE